MDLNPERPALMFHLLFIREEFRDTIESVINDQEIPLRLSTCIDMVDFRKRWKLMLSETSLKELPVESLPIVSNNTISILEDIVEFLAEEPVVIYVLLPGGKIPSVNTMNLR